jgi:hypothetical protein
MAFTLGGVHRRGTNNYFPSGYNDLQPLGHVAEIFGWEKKTLGTDFYAVFLFHARTDVGLGTSIFFT